jgi:hypothetical protein
MTQSKGAAPGPRIEHLALVLAEPRRRAVLCAVQVDSMPRSIFVAGCPAWSPMSVVASSHPAPPVAAPPGPQRADAHGGITRSFRQATWPHPQAARQRAIRRLPAPHALERRPSRLCPRGVFDHLEPRRAQLLLHRLASEHPSCRGASTVAARPLRRGAGSSSSPPAPARLSRPPGNPPLGPRADHPPATTRSKGNSSARTWQTSSACPRASAAWERLPAGPLHPPARIRSAPGSMSTPTR